MDFSLGLSGKTVFQQENTQWNLGIYVTLWLWLKNSILPELRKNSVPFNLPSVSKLKI
jgi:hypothetical protein